MKHSSASNWIKLARKVLWAAVFPPSGHETGVFAETLHGQRFALHLGMKMVHQGACIFAENVSRLGLGNGRLGAAFLRQPPQTGRAAGKKGAGQAPFWL
ncbi:hypothetical protein CV945_09235 [Geobacillus sp. Manikaran-105]|nr:hypothetical protein CV945_09235 [Geobacillus sp. Manikaran-105]PJW18590.1 hypothetical protein CV944_02880 [Geobacillus sp. WSUCF-018B]